MPILAIIFTWLVEKFGASAVKTAIVGSAKAISWIMVIAVYTFAIGGILTVVTLFQNLLNKIMSLNNTGGLIASQINSVFHCSGIWTGIETAFPIVFTAVIFVLVISLNNIVMSVKNRVENDVKDMVNLF